MPKLHTRQKRKLRMKGIKGRDRKPRPKTFRTEETAKKYAESKGIRKYKLEDLHANSPNRRKFRIVLE